MGTRDADQHVAMRPSTIGQLNYLQSVRNTVSSRQGLRTAPAYGTAGSLTSSNLPSRPASLFRNSTSASGAAFSQKEGSRAASASCRMASAGALRVPNHLNVSRSQLPPRQAPVMVMSPPRRQKSWRFDGEQSAAPTNWLKSKARLQRSRSFLTEEQRLDMQSEALDDHVDAKEQANECWDAGLYEECVGHLSDCLRLNRHSDVLHRYRARVHKHVGKLVPALEDAEAAAIINPKSADNHLIHGEMLHRSHRLPQAGRAYLEAMHLGADTTEAVDRYHGLLATLHRDRIFYNTTHEPYKAVAEAHRLTLSSTRPSVFDPRRILSGDDGYIGLPPEEPPNPRIVEIGDTHVKLAWEVPYEANVLELSFFTVDMSAYEVVWEQESQDFFEGFRPWVQAYDGAARLTFCEISGLKMDNTYKFRVKSRNRAGESPWSDVVQARTTALELKRKAKRRCVPRSWLRVDLSDLMQRQRQLDELEDLDFFREVAASLHPHVRDLRRVFKHYCQMGATGVLIRAEGLHAMSLTQFHRLLREIGVVKPKDGAEVEVPRPPGAVLLTSKEADLIFQRAKLTEVQSRGAGVDTEVNLQLADEALSELGGGSDDEAGDDEDGGSGKLVLHEFVNAIIRVAWSCYPSGGALEEDASSEKQAPVQSASRATADAAHAMIGSRLQAFLQQAMLPGCKDCLRRADEDPLSRHLGGRRVRAVFDFYGPSLRQVFSHYAKADHESGGALETLQHMNLRELVMMLKEGHMMDDVVLDSAQVLKIFQDVNASFAESGFDADEDELCYEEFMHVVASICNLKIPESTRGGEPFEHTLQAWLVLTFIPTYKALLKKAAKNKKNR